MPAGEGPPEVPPALAASPTPDFDLSSLATQDGTIDFDIVRRRCSSATRPGEIVVCAPDPDADRLGDATGFKGYEYVEEGPPRAAWKLNESVELDIHTDAETLGNGVVSKRVMVGAKITF